MPVVEPRIRNNVCLTSHPGGCAAIVKEQIDYVKKQGPIAMPKRVLVIGGSTGYSLSTRIAAAFGGGADTISVSFEKEPTERKPGTPGHYNNLAFDTYAREAGLKAVSLNKDAFSHETRREVVELVRETFGQVDLLVYSLASGVRPDPDTGEMYRSALKPLEEPYTALSVDFMNGEVSEVTIDPATDEDLRGTVKTMGGEDWTLWVDALLEAGLLAEGVRTVAYSYIGPAVTFPVYREGTIGKAKEHLEATAGTLGRKLASLKGEAFVSVNKALVTRASAVIPVVPLYISLLFRIMKEKGTHEGCIEQMYRMLADRVYGADGVVRDDQGLVRLDDWEMDPVVQQTVADLWDTITGDNIGSRADLEGYREDYLKLHGFGVEGIDYSRDVDLTRID